MNKTLILTFTIVLLIGCKNENNNPNDLSIKELALQIDSISSVYEGWTIYPILRGRNRIIIHNQDTTFYVLSFVPGKRKHLSYEYYVDPFDQFLEEIEKHEYEKEDSLLNNAYDVIQDLYSNDIVAIDNDRECYITRICTKVPSLEFEDAYYVFINYDCDSCLKNKTYDAIDSLKPTGVYSWYYYSSYSFADWIQKRSKKKRLW